MNSVCLKLVTLSMDLSRVDRNAICETLGFPHDFYGLG